MGKGDIRSRRGKIWRGTTGVTRPRKRKKQRAVAPPTRKVKDLKSLKTAVAETGQKKVAAEIVQPMVEVNTSAVETAAVETAASETSKAKKPRKPIVKKSSAKK